MATRIEKIYPSVTPPTSKELDRLFGHISNQRGNAAECLGDKALDYFVARGHLIYCWWESSLNEVARGLAIDRRVVRKNDGAVIDIQIKSSDIGVAKHLRKHPDVPCCVNIQPENPDEEAFQRMEYAIINAPYSLI